VSGVQIAGSVGSFLIVVSIAWQTLVVATFRLHCPGVVFSVARSAGAKVLRGRDATVRAGMGGPSGVLNVCLVAVYGVSSDCG
jgi:hypothetical protein